MSRKIEIEISDELDIILSTLVERGLYQSKEEMIIELLERVLSDYTNKPSIKLESFPEADLGKIKEDMITRASIYNDYLSDRF